MLIATYLTQLLKQFECQPLTHSHTFSHTLLLVLQVGVTLLGKCLIYKRILVVFSHGNTIHFHYFHYFVRVTTHEGITEKG